MAIPEEVPIVGAETRVKLTGLFSKLQTHPGVLTDLYTKLNCQYLLIPHPIADGKL